MQSGRVKAAKIVKTVKNGPLSISVRAYADGRFGFDFKPDGGERLKIRLIDAGAAEKRARELLGTAGAGKLDLLSITPELFEEFLRWKATRRVVPYVGTLVTSFLESKQDKGRSYWHLRGLRLTLESFSKEFSDVKVDQVSREAMEVWLNGRKVGPRRWNNLLEPVVSMIRFARRQGSISAEIHPIEGIEKKFTRPVIQTYTVDELERLLAVVQPAWLPVVALGAFCGLRPEEACSCPRAHKESLTWENILWDKGVVDVPAAVSKVKTRRFAPLTDAARAFLEPGRNKTGRIAPNARISDTLKGWVRKSKVPWKKDALRHTFASMRLADVKSMDQVALEMGNTRAILLANYLNLQHESEAKKYWAIRPK